MQERRKYTPFYLAENLRSEITELKLSWATAEHQRATLQALLTELYDYGMISGLHDRDCKGAENCECELARRVDAALFPRK